VLCNLSTVAWIVVYLSELLYLLFCNDTVFIRLYGTIGQDNYCIIRWKGCGSGRLWPNCRQSLALTTRNIIGVHRVWTRDLSVSLTLTSHIVFMPKVSSLFNQYVTCPLFQFLNFWCSAHSCRASSASRRIRISVLPTHSFIVTRDFCALLSYSCINLRLMFILSRMALHPLPGPCLPPKAPPFFSIPSSFDVVCLGFVMCPFGQRPPSCSWFP